MAPTIGEHRNVDPSGFERRNRNTFGDWRDSKSADTFAIEGWAEGFIIGALMLMSLITVANMRRGVVLRKLILLELVLAKGQGTVCFMSFKGYGWYLSSTAALLYSSYFTHNVPSFEATTCKWVKCMYLTTLAMTIPALISQIFNNFRFFNDQSRLYKRVRPYEPLMRDPWWIFSCLVLFHIIRTSYFFNVFKLVAKSPRFGILLAAIFLAAVFTIMDVLASVIRDLSSTDG
ncbi:hypothetical protein N7474_006879 [Penicillium riverlandense]|uniref:uncharacterized protein n=1 Tax=Penicillium riverlandense TaxID=1903569 RepID=UPI002548DD67|nr:uncharacterized protein N7474_006879 [Penicillium riverlandense]KAJ5815102.1 hypothetical protein N7474_006879 [Penicillium riverlandense]